MQYTNVKTLAQLIAKNNVANSSNCTINVNSTSIQLTCAQYKHTNTLHFTCTNTLAQTLAQLLAMQLSKEFCYMCINLYNNSAAIRALGEQYEMEL